MLKSSTPWNDSELEQLRNLYLCHTSCKHIAREMNRSYESVSTALSRYGMRLKRSQKSRALNENRGNSRSLKKDIELQDDIWVDLEEIRAYLERHRIFMTSIEKSLFSTQSPEKQLLLANKIRISKGEAIFMVEGVTCA
jgi:hypothetical protein